MTMFFGSGPKTGIKPELRRHWNALLTLRRRKDVPLSNLTNASSTVSNTPRPSHTVSCRKPGAGSIHGYLRKLLLPEPNPLTADMQFVVQVTTAESKRKRFRIIRKQ